MKENKNNRCCFVTWKSQGRTYQKCKVVKFDKHVINDLKDILEDRFTHVHIECSTNFLSFKYLFIFLLFIFFQINYIRFYYGII